MCACVGGWVGVGGQAVDMSPFRRGNQVNACVFSAIRFEYRVYACCRVGARASHPLTTPPTPHIPHTDHPLTPQPPTPHTPLKQAIYLITTGARESAFRNIKTIAETLADEIINAAKGSSNSYAIKKKDEVERVAKANR